MIPVQSPTYAGRFLVGQQSGTPNRFHEMSDLQEGKRLGGQSLSALLQRAMPDH